MGGNHQNVLNHEFNCQHKYYCHQAMYLDPSENKLTFNNRFVIYYIWNFVSSPKFISCYSVGCVCFYFVLEVLLFVWGLWCITPLSTIYQLYRGLDLQLPMQSVHVTNKVLCSNLVHGKVYSMQPYVIKFVSDLRQVGGFPWVLQFPPPIKLTAMI
jgi:hypothetical protein